MKKSKELTLQMIALQNAMQTLATDCLKAAEHLREFMAAWEEAGRDDQKHR